MIICCNIEFLLPSSPVCVLDLAKFYSPFPLLVAHTVCFTILDAIKKSTAPFDDN